jgi:hypothetical protein
MLSIAVSKSAILLRSAFMDMVWFGLMVIKNAKDLVCGEFNEILHHEKFG